MAGNVVDRLLRSDEPSVRWKVRTQVLSEPADAPATRRLQGQIRRSPRVRRMLDGDLPPRAYAKWRGAHWVLATLADIGYPPGDKALAPLRDTLLDTWLRKGFYHSVPLVAGRYRRCGSQQGYPLLALTTLDLGSDRTGDLVERLLHWQWPDGGWNCDRNPSADTSSFHETLLPMRGLSAYARTHGDARAAGAARKAADVFLQRRLAFRRSTGQLMDRAFIRLRYPSYWHYDVLGGLKGMVDVGLIRDDRCADALDLLESKRLPDGGWPAETRLYRRADQSGPHDWVDWGGVDAKRTNEWVTADALAVLRAAGRI
jgi:hypothetical protein